MKAFLKLGILLALSCTLIFWASADETTAPLITGDNFVSLEFFNRADKDEQGYLLRLDNSGLRVKFRQTTTGALPSNGLLRDADIWSEPAPLSKNQLAACLTFLNSKHIPKLAGYYNGKSNVTGLVQALTLTISDDKQRDQKFEVQNFGDEAPRAFYEIADYLRNLQIQKFTARNLPIPTKDWVTIDNFQKITLETSGGFAGVHSTLEVNRRPLNSSLGGWVSTWSQIIAGRQTTQNDEVFFDARDEIIRLANVANFAKLNGQSFKQAGLADGFNETLTLTLSNGQTFTVSNYGDQAPPELCALIQYLRDSKKKIPTEKS